MSKSLTVFRIFLVLATAIFMAFHTQIFISRIEPNFIFSWTASLVIEGFLISLALSKTLISRILIIPLFCISVIAASASFVVQNERLLDQFFTQKRVIEQLKTDLSETQKAYDYGQRYTTKTLQRERQIQDELRAILKTQNGDITLINSLIFLVLVLIMQSVSIYTATTLKNGNFRKPETENSKVFEPETKSFQKISTETFTENSETSDGKLERPEADTRKTERNGNGKSLNEESKKMIVDRIKECRNEGMKLEDLSGATGISKSTLSKVLAYPAYPVSDEIFKKISGKI